jgi:hypothetical protein
VTDASGSWWLANSGNVGVAIGVLSILVAAAIAFGQRRPKRLSWDIRIDERIVSSFGLRAPNLRLLWDDQDIKEPRLVRVRIQNTGRRVVLSQDVLSPIRICLPDAKVLSVRISAANYALFDEEPLGLVHVDADGIVVVDLPSLNAGDRFDVQVIADGGDWVDVTGRIADETSPFRYHRLVNRPSRQRAAMGIGATVALGGGLASLYLWELGTATILFTVVGAWLAVLIPMAFQSVERVREERIDRGGNRDRGHFIPDRTPSQEVDQRRELNASSNDDEANSRARGNEGPALQLRAPD